MRRYVIALLILLTAGGLFASDTGPAADPPGPLTLDACLRLALEAAEERGRFEPGLAQAQAELAEARSFSYPQLRVSPGAGYFFESASWNPEVQADLGEHLLEIPQNVARRRLAQDQLGIARTLQSRSRCRFAADVMRAYVDCLRARQDLGLAEERLGAARKAAAAWGRMTPGERSVRERRDAARNALRDAGAQAEQARVRCDQAGTWLGTLCALPPDRVADLADVDAVAMPEVTLERCLEWARAQRSDLDAAAREVALTSRAATLTRMQNWPKAGVSFGYRQNEEEEDGTQKDEGAYAYLRVQVPVWDAGLTRARVASIRARRDALTVRHADLESSIVRTVTTAFTELQRELHALRSARSATQPRDRFRRAEIRYRNGEIPESEFDAARHDWALAQTDVLTRKWDCLAAEADLLEALEATRGQWHAGLVPAEGETAPQ